MKDQVYWNAFNLIPKMGPVKFQKLLSRFPFLKKAWGASIKELKKCGFKPNELEEIISGRNKINPQAEWEKLEHAEINLITIRDKKYPSLLKEIYHPPALLYYKGDFNTFSDFTIAIVGTRKPSTYGREVAAEIVSAIAPAGITVISGLALGIDGIAHKTALEQKGKTIAVLGSGLDQIYPRFHYQLAMDIVAQGGLVISEFPFSTPPLPHHFPYRNRIIAGLSLGTVVIEAGPESGALITARYALEQNREVFAIPGSIYNKNSQGPNNLIKMGAKVVTQAQDILETLNIKRAFSFKAVQKISADSKEEELILKILSSEPIHIDQIVTESKLPAAEINSTLTLMEMKGKVRNIGGMYYVLGH